MYDDLQWTAQVNPVSGTVEIGYATSFLMTSSVMELTCSCEADMPIMALTVGQKKMLKDDVECIPLQAAGAAVLQLRTFAHSSDQKLSPEQIVPKQENYI